MGDLGLEFLMDRVKNAGNTSASSLDLGAFAMLVDIQRDYGYYIMITMPSVNEDANVTVAICIPGENEGDEVVWQGHAENIAVAAKYAVQEMFKSPLWQEHYTAKKKGTN